MVWPIFSVTDTRKFLEMWESSQINGAQTNEQSKDVLILEAIFIIWDTKLFLKHLFMFLGKSFIRQNVESVLLGILEKSPKFWRPQCLQLRWDGGTAWYPRSLGFWFSAPVQYNWGPALCKQELPPLSPPFSLSPPPLVPLDSACILTGRTGYIICEV